MAAYKRVRQLEPVDAAYLAGLIDGEGTISLARKHRNDNRQLVITISSTERAILEYVLEVTGAGKITGKRTYQSHHAPSFTYCVTNRQALDLLEQTFPYLRSYKVARARLVLERYLDLTPRNGRYTTEQWTEREAFVEEFLATRPHG